jgi:hypothetical protein
MTLTLHCSVDKKTFVKNKLTGRRRDIQQNDTRRNGIKHNDM